MPLPEMSVKMLPRTMVFAVLSASRSPAAPRWVNTESLNSSPLPPDTVMLPGSGVHEAYGHLPLGTNWHRPCTAQPSGPVLV